MAFTDIDNPESLFAATLYTGNSTARTITTGMESDLIWIKQRSTVRPNVLFDTLTTNHFASNNSKYLVANTTAVLTSNDSTQLTGVTSTGFTLGTDSSDQINGNGDTAVAWTWNESATAGFDIVQYTGNGGTQNISHNLSSVPEVIFGKQQSGSTNGWGIYHVSVGNGKALQFDTATPSTATAFFNDTTPTSSVFSLGDSGRLNQNSETYIAYIWCGKQGFSKYGKYFGNNEGSDGVFVYLGFTPQLLMVRRVDSGDDWKMVTRKVEKFNPMNQSLKANAAVAEAAESDHAIDFVSNGFKLRENNAAFNASGEYIYLAWAETPFVNSKGNPNTAR